MLRSVRKTRRAPGNEGEQLGLCPRSRLFLDALVLEDGAVAAGQLPARRWFLLLPTPGRGWCSLPAPPGGPRHSRAYEPLRDAREGERTSNEQEEEGAPKRGRTAGLGGGGEEGAGARVSRSQRRLLFGLRVGLACRKPGPSPGLCWEPAFWHLRTVGEDAPWPPRRSAALRLWSSRSLNLSPRIT